MTTRVYLNNENQKNQNQNNYIKMRFSVRGFHAFQSAVVKIVNCRTFTNQLINTSVTKTVTCTAIYNHIILHILDYCSISVKMLNCDLGGVCALIWCKMSLLKVTYLTTHDCVQHNSIIALTLPNITVSSQYVINRLLKYQNMPRVQNNVGYMYQINAMYIILVSYYHMYYRSSF